MGVEKQLIRPGTGPKPVAGQTVTVHCTGFGKHGDLSQKFWSTKDAGQSLLHSRLVWEMLSKDGMKVSWVCKWEKLHAYGALRTMLMDQADFLLGEYKQTRSWILRLKC